AGSSPASGVLFVLCKGTFFVPTTFTRSLHDPTFVCIEHTFLCTDRKFHQSALTTRVSALDGRVRPMRDSDFSLLTTPSSPVLLGNTEPSPACSSVACQRRRQKRQQARLLLCRLHAWAFGDRGRHLIVRCDLADGLDWRRGPTRAFGGRACYLAIPGKRESTRDDRACFALCHCGSGRRHRVIRCIRGDSGTCAGGAGGQRGCGVGRGGACRQVVLGLGGGGG
ncbi:hypothetical protein BCR44DRAFT_405949, partial [Catenaria anguillulae PL171]